MEDSNSNMHDDLISLMDGMLKVAQVCYPEISEQEMRARIVAANLKGMVQVILMGDDDTNPLKLDFKQICLGLLAVSDWIDPEVIE